MSRSLPQIPDDEVEISAIRAQGAGGQNVNKVSNAVHLRFDIRASSLTDEIKARLLALPDQRISKDGVVIIKAQAFRSLEKNRGEALRRLAQLVAAASEVARPRRPTRPTPGAVERRLAAKARHAAIKAERRRTND